MDVTRVENNAVLIHTLSCSDIIMRMGSTNDRRRYLIKSSLTGGAYTQDDHCTYWHIVSIKLHIHTYIIINHTIQPFQNTEEPYRAYWDWLKHTDNNSVFLKLCQFALNNSHYFSSGKYNFLIWCNVQCDINISNKNCNNVTIRPTLTKIWQKMLPYCILHSIWPWHTRRLQ